MTTVEIELDSVEQSSRKRKAEAPPRKESLVDKGIRLLSSVRFGIVMLVLMLVCCMIGMLIMQQNVEGFRQYYQKLSPAQRELYGTLGFFDIYRSWYFTLLLAVTGLNIILSSIDRFPTAWRYIRRPKLLASPNFVRAQTFHIATELSGSTEKAVESISDSWKAQGFRPRVTKDQASITLFAQRNVWNRLGAYVVHAALLTIFVGGFLTSRYGIGGVMEIKPGQSSDVFVTFESGIAGDKVSKAQMPFSVECTDLQQQLVRPEGGLDVMNTIDWLSYIKIRDGGEEVPALVHLNFPFDHRGYRFFQSSFQPQGNARTITLELESPEGNRRVTISRDGAADVEGVGRVAFTAFYPDFINQHGHGATASDDYNNPVAELQITEPDGNVRQAFAHGEVFGKANRDNTGPAGSIDSAIVLKSFEKVASSHTLTVQYDPGRMPVYVGFALLAISLCSIFLFSHQRIWAVIEGNGKRSRVYIGGHTTRNKAAFEDRFNSLVKSVIGGKAENE